MSYRYKGYNLLWIILMLTGVIGLFDAMAFAEKMADEATEKLKVLSESMKPSDITQIRKLIKNGADINAYNKYGGTPLVMASGKGHTQIVKLLLSAMADVNTTLADGATPLYVASEQGHIEVVALLLSAMANVNAAIEDGTTPLLIASQKGHTEIVKLLKKYGAKK